MQDVEVRPGSPGLIIRLPDEGNRIVPPAGTRAILTPFVRRRIAAGDLVEVTAHRQPAPQARRRRPDNTANTEE